MKNELFLYCIAIMVISFIASSCRNEERYIDYKPEKRPIGSNEYIEINDPDTIEFVPHGGAIPSEVAICKIAESIWFSSHGVSVYYSQYPFEVHQENSNTWIAHNKRRYECEKGVYITFIKNNSRYARGY